MGRRICATAAVSEIVMSSLGMFWSARMPAVSIGTFIDLVLKIRGSGK
jgi:hypothetical protein